MKNRLSIWLLLAIFTLVIIGVIMVYSASYPEALSNFGNGMYYVNRHLVFLLLGFVGMIFAYKIPMSVWKRYSVFLFVISVILCGLTFTSLGVSHYGARRWIQFSPSMPQMQPSDFLKLGILIYFPAILNRVNRNDYSRFLLIAVIGLCAGIVYAQKDLGTTIVIAVVMFNMYFLSNMKLSELPLYIVLAGAFLYKAIFGYGYRAMRFKVFLDPYIDKFDKGWGIIQSSYAIANGGILGVGVGNSIQKFYYIFAAHSDYIFAIIAEELGLVGAMGIIFLITYISLTFANRAFKIINDYEKFVLLGVSFYIGLQSMIHIGVVVNAIPAKGITLPFISYGGSSIMAYMIMVGFALNIMRNGKIRSVKKSENSN